MTKSSEKRARCKKFRSESELVYAVKKIGPSALLPNHRGLTRVFSEFVGTNGIADIVLMELDHAWNERLSLAFVDPGWAGVFATLTAKTFNQCFISSKSGCSERYVATVLRRLEQGGVIVRKNNSTWSLRYKMKPVARKIVSIECKLKDWRRALYQATRYRDYANESWVFLDGGSSKGAIKSLGMFEKFNVGLATVDVNENLAIYHRPLKSKPRHEFSFWHANSMAAKRLRSID